MSAGLANTMNVQEVCKTGKNKFTKYILHQHTLLGLRVICIKLRFEEYTVAQFLHSQDKRVTPNKQTVTPVLLYANIKTSSEIRGHLKTLCLMYSYMNGNHIYIHILPTPLSQYQDPVTVGVIYVRNAFRPLVTPDQLLGCNSLPHYKKELASSILNYNKQLTYKSFMSHYHFHRVLILSDNYRLSLLTATPRSMWVVGWVSYVNMTNGPIDSSVRYLSDKIMIL